MKTEEEELACRGSGNLITYRPLNECVFNKDRAGCEMLDLRILDLKQTSGCLGVAVLRKFKVSLYASRLADDGFSMKRWLVGLLEGIPPRTGLPSGDSQALALRFIGEFF